MMRHYVPIFYVGDIWDHYNQPPEAINWAIKHLPHGYAIPGQHDLAYHNYEDIRRTAYWTLVEAGVIKNLAPGGPHTMPNGIHIWAYPWGHEVKPVHPSRDPGVRVAMVHAYIWRAGGYGYPGAPEGARADKWAERLAGYDAAVFGDNHRGFTDGKIFNCGGLIRRKSDEAGYTPGIGLLHADGTWARYMLDTSEEKFTQTTEAGAAVGDHDLDKFLDALLVAQEDGLDFAGAIEAVCADTSSGLTPRTVELLRAALDATRHPKV
jgi:hypothetical protein